MDAELLPGIVASIPTGAWMSYGDVARAAGGGDTHARSLISRQLASICGPAAVKSRLAFCN